MAKLVVAIVFIIVGIGAMIYRFTKRVFDKTNMIKMFKKAKESGLYASQICENLDLPYYSLPYDVLKLEKLNVSEQDWIIGNYRIIDLISLGDKILFLVECNFNDIDIAWKGQLEEIAKVKYDFFLLANNMDEKKLTLYGFVYEGNPEKFRKKYFAKKLLEDLV